MTGKMPEITRYKMDCSLYACAMGESPDGDYIEYKDHEDTVERLEKENAELVGQLKNTIYSLECAKEKTDGQKIRLKDWNYLALGLAVASEIRDIKKLLKTHGGQDDL